MVRQLPTGQAVSMRAAPEWFQSMMQRIVRENVPDKYVQDKDWGKKDRRWDGLKIRRDGLKISTKRRWKQVNHGTWRRYEITQVAPETNLRLRIENIHDVGDGKVGFEVSLASKLRAFGRVSKWSKGVQLYSLSVEADADVRLRIWCQLGLRLDWTHLPPDVLLVPTVTRAELAVTGFRVHRISKLGGVAARELGRSLERILRDKIEEKQDELPEKINRQIAKHEDRMRFSMSGFAARKWRALVGMDAEESRQGE